MDGREFPNKFPHYDGELLMPEDASHRKVSPVNVFQAMQLKAEWEWPVRVTPRLPVVSIWSVLLALQSETDPPPHTHTTFWHACILGARLLVVFRFEPEWETTDASLPWIQKNCWNKSEHAFTFCNRTDSCRLQREVEETSGHSHENIGHSPAQRSGRPRRRQCVHWIIRFVLMYFVLNSRLLQRSVASEKNCEAHPTKTCFQDLFSCLLLCFRNSIAVFSLGKLLHGWCEQCKASTRISWESPGADSKASTTPKTEKSDFSVRRCRTVGAGSSIVWQAWDAERTGQMPDSVSVWTLHLFLEATNAKWEERFVVFYWAWVKLCFFFFSDCTTCTKLCWKTTTYLMSCSTGDLGIYLPFSFWNRISRIKLASTPKWQNRWELK